jgi:hypothetical protein
MTNPLTNPHPLSDMNGQLMAMSAHRYCLGRQSYIVGACIEWLRQWWPELNENTRSVILRDTIEALQDDNAGSRYDSAEWKTFAEWGWGQLTDEGKKQAIRAVNQERPWPLGVKS